MSDQNNSHIEIIENSKKRKWCVYIHRNMINNKAYIGITSRNPEERWGNNGNQYRKRNEVAFSAAIQKYGWNNFEHIIWTDNLSKEEAKAWEIRLIALFKTNCAKYKNPSYGYNLTDGGEGTNGYKHTNEAREKMSEAKIGCKPWNAGKTLSNEMRKKLSDAHKGQEISEEQRKKIGIKSKEYWSNSENKQKNSGKNSYNFGRHLSDETKEKISLANKGKQYSDEFKKKLSESHIGFVVSEETKSKISEHSANKRIIIQLTLNNEYVQIYKSLKEAEKKTGIRYQNISACLRQITSCAGGFHWMYEEDYDILTKQND